MPREYWLLTDWRRFMWLHLFSIRSNSPHNRPLRPLCGWVFHIEGRQRDQFEIDSFGYISYFLCKCSGGHVQFQFWGDAIVLWVKIQCCFVATTKLKFCGCYKSHLSWKPPIARPCLSWVSVINLVDREEKVGILFAFENPFWDRLHGAGCRYGLQVLPQPRWKIPSN